METLYKLAAHLLFLDDEKSAVNYIKSDESESIIFEAKDENLFEIECYDKLYTNLDFVIEKKQYSENGEVVVITYSSKDRKIILKEYYTSYKSGIIEKSIGIKLRYSGKISKSKFYIPELKSSKEVEMGLIAPFTPYFCLTPKEKDADLNMFDSKNRGVMLINSQRKSESCLIWCDNKRGISKYSENRIYFEIDEEIESSEREEIELGRVFLSFYKGSYIENLENCSGYLGKSGYYSEKNREGLFSKTLEMYKKGRVTGREFFRWIEIIKIVANKIEIEADGKIDAEKQFFSIIGAAKFISSGIDEEYREIIEKGRVVKQLQNICSDRNVLGVIKKIRGSFLLFLFNFSLLKRKTEVILDSEFEDENIKFHRYFLKNIENGSVTGSYIKEKGAEIEIGANEVKILKFEPVLLKDELGEKFDIKEDKEEYSAVNSFYELNISKKESGIDSIFVNGFEKSIICGTKVEFDGVDNFEMSCSKKKASFKSEKLSLSYSVSNKNSIILKVENEGVSGKITVELNGIERIIADTTIVEEGKREEFSELIFTGENGIKFEKIKKGSIISAELNLKKVIFNFEKSSLKKKSSEIKITIV